MQDPRTINLAQAYERGRLIAKTMQALGVARSSAKSRQEHHRGFRPLLMNNVFNSALLAGLIPFTQQHGHGAISALPSFEYAQKVADHGVPAHG